MHLESLKWIIEFMEEGEFGEYKPYMVPLFDTICRIWANSEHYSTPSKLTVLLKEICNLMIKQVEEELFNLLNL